MATSTQFSMAEPRKKVIYSDIQLRVFELNRLLYDNNKELRVEISAPGAEKEVIVFNAKNHTQIYSGPYDFANTFMLGMKQALQSK